MLSKKKMIAIGKAVATGSMQEEQNLAMPGDPNKEHRYAVRGATSRILDELWHEAFTNVEREQFNYDRNAFVSATGWV